MTYLKKLFAVKSIKFKSENHFYYCIYPKLYLLAHTLLPKMSPINFAWSLSTILYNFMPSQYFDTPLYSLPKSNSCHKALKIKK